MKISFFLSIQQIKHLPLFIEGFREKPDSLGILKEYILQMPSFSRAGYFSSDSLPPAGFLPGNRNHLWLIDSDKKLLNAPVYSKKMNDVPFFLLQDPVRQEGLFTIFQLLDNRYLVLLPLAGEKTMTWINFREGEQLTLSVASLGTDEVYDDVPILAWSVSDDMYEATYMVWKQVIDANIPDTGFRTQKKYTEVFKYLGWCTWEEYKRDINAGILENVIKRIRNSGVPVRFMLFDNGHEYLETNGFENHRKFKLKSFKPDPVRFPGGWEPIIRMKDSSEYNMI